jgi:hypothetical protein
MTTNEAVMNANPESTRHLINVFEQSLELLGEDKKGTVPIKAQNPIFRRSALPLHIDPANLQKRAIDEAARALTALWKISKPERHKLPPRALPCTR